jgi:hypothetical protein
MIFFEKLFLFTFVFLLFAVTGEAQTADSAAVEQSINEKDSIINPIMPSAGLKKSDNVNLKNLNYRSPRGAAIRSAVLPGWGQVYNKKWWKVPVVYVVLGGTAWYFLDSRKWYKEFQLGYKVAYNIATKGDSTGYDKIKIFEVKNAVNLNLQNQLKAYRDNYRRDVDYSAVYFLLAWALNVIDATVDAHLSSFDIGPDLSFKFKTGYSEFAKTNGVSLVLTFK